MIKWYFCKSTPFQKYIYSDKKGQPVLRAVLFYESYKIDATI